MVKQGWLTGWGVRGDDYVVLWTDEGRERMRWLRVLERDIELIKPSGMSSDKAMSMVRAVCRLEDRSDARH